VDDLRLRMTYSKDIRAPNINELYSKPPSGFGQLTDDVSHLTNQVLTITGGNPNLKPERAFNLTYGVVYTPSWLANFHVSVDYYNVIVEGAIAGVGGQAVIDRCYLDGEANYCANI